MTSQLLTRAPHRNDARPALTFLGDLALPLARVHEFCGNARHLLAAIVAAKLQGPVFWISPAWQAERLNPDGLMRLMEPGRITFLEPGRAEDLLWCMEEVLRSGAVPLVVADIPAPPGLVPVRRLHLAAETGTAESAGRPLGLLLTPGQGGAPGIETRWHMGCDHRPGDHGWRLDRLRARTAPQKSWRVVPEGRAFRLTTSEVEVA